MNPPANQSIRITASFTAEPLRGTLTHWLGQLGIGGELSFSGYGQILQEALDPSSASSRNGSGGANVFLLRPSDIGGALDEIREALAALTARSKAHHLAILCPEADASADEAAAVERLSGIERLEVVTARQWLDLYPVADAFDPEADASAHIPYSDALYAALATVIARRLHLGMRPPTKVLVLDADNTLWSGVCGEDGASGVELDGPWKAVRQFALAKRREGLLLALCSKNHPADVEAVFSERADELGLGREDFSGWKINWNPKSQNLRELADELRLGLDSFVFLDDNPAEVAEVAANCPGVVALTLPENVEEIPAFLGHLWPLDTAVATAEDATRAEFYRQENGRRELLDSAPSFADFLRSLDLDIDIAEATGEDLPRIAQLATRTNQFNLNPLRLSEAELKSRIGEGATCLAVRVRDRFGDYGLVGATLYRLPATDAPATVDLFLLSCRAMGKGVERAMVVALAQRALSAGARTLGFAHQTTDRNDPARTFFQSIGGFQLDATDAAQLSPIPDDPRTEPTHPKAAPVSSAARTGLTSALAQRIATEWRSPADLHRHLTAVRRPRPDLSQALLLPGTKLERQLAGLWSELLGLEIVGVDDPFSSLGGDSIRLARLHAEILRRFRVPLELVELFELPTIRDQSARIETASHPIATTEDLRPATDANEDNEVAVAIIGMALRVPGADSPDTFWRNLVDGVESISHFQRDEIEYPEEYDKPGYVPAKGLVEGIDLFDANFFGILPKDARIMDPQQRIFLELAWEA
ncbi:MAG TPA: HAD-IIIC family phosphatase, partial [Bacteroidia bacterium]|nr:HAD-IIIC family phosphatase [Bacteroidia bacterium]